MIVTEDAKRELRKRLETQMNNPEVALRLELKPPGYFGLVPDKESDGDQVIEYGGSKVLLIERGIADIVGRLTLGVQAMAEGPELVLSETRKDGQKVKEGGYFFRECRTGP